MARRKAAVRGERMQLATGHAITAMGVHPISRVRSVARGAKAVPSKVVVKGPNK